MKKQKDTDKFQKYTVIFGYALFASIILLEIIGAGLMIGNILAHNTTPTRLRFVTVIALMSLSAILPPLISYFMGELSTKKKLSALAHHFNGILFAGTAFIVWLLLITINFRWVILDDITFIPGRFMQFWPALAAIVIMVILAIGYAKSKTKDTVLSYKPFTIALITGIIGFILTGLYSQIDVIKNSHTLDMLINNALPGALATLVALGMLLVSYSLKISRQHPPLKRAATSATITLIGVLTLGTIGQLIARFLTDLSALNISLVTSISGLCIWLFYLHSINALRSK